MKKHLSFLIFLIVFGTCHLGLCDTTGLKKLFEEATAAFAAGDHLKAINLYEKSLEIYPEFAPGYNYLGMAHRAWGTDIREVAWLYKTAIEIDPNYAMAYDNLGKAYYSLGDFDKAAINCHKAVELDPNLVTAKLALGWIYLLGKSMPKDAIGYFEDVVRNESNALPYAYFGLDIAYFMDYQPHKVLEMITILRKTGEEEFAVQLEQMVREKRYLDQIEPGKPLISVQNQLGSYAGIGLDTMDLFPDAASEENAGQRKVRLRRKADQVRDVTPESNKDLLSGSERIRVLQRRRAGLQN